MPPPPGLALRVQASAALENYGVHLVVANLLHTRKDEVTLVEARKGGGRSSDSRSGQPDACPHACETTVLRRPAHEGDIERLLVAEVARRHSAFRTAAAAAAVSTPDTVS